MKIIPPSHKILFMPDPSTILETIELAGRTCYKSEERITADSAGKFVRRIIKSGHHSVIEHMSISIRFVCDRGVSHELVRHRLAAYSQESTRYCDYTRDGLQFIRPLWYREFLPLGRYWLRPKNGRVIFQIGDDESALEELPPFPTDDVGNCAKLWLESMAEVESSYFSMRFYSASPEHARSVLPNSLKTEIVMTANLREWRHVLKLRTGKAAHPQIREIMLPILAELKNKLPDVFGDLH